MVYYRNFYLFCIQIAGNIYSIVFIYNYYVLKGNEVKNNVETYEPHRSPPAEKMPVIEADEKKHPCFSDGVNMNNSRIPPHESYAL